MKNKKYVTVYESQKNDDKENYWISDTYDKFQDVSTELWNDHNIFYVGGCLPIKLHQEEDGRILMKFGQEDDGHIWFYKKGYVNQGHEFSFSTGWCLDFAKHMIELLQYIEHGKRYGKFK